MPASVNPQNGGDTKGGGMRGGPKRWTGKGPRPARHIPWPEIFKHHLSVVEGHMKMIGMIRKHTEEGTSNRASIEVLYERCVEMLDMTKRASRNFMPPEDLFQQVPIGSSSASMYPGYSPADHVYGEASAEYGEYASKAQKEGRDLSTQRNGPEYEIGQSRKAKRAALSRQPNTKNGNRLATDGNAIPLGKPKVTEGQKQQEEANPYFVIDTNPMPVNSALPSAIATKEGKKGKKDNSPQDAVTVSLPAMDDTNLPKEEKRAKKERKRKRETEEAAAAEAAAAESTDATKADDEGDLPKAKKSKDSKSSPTTNYATADEVQSSKKKEKKPKADKKDKKAKKEKKEKRSKSK